MNTFQNSRQLGNRIARSGQQPPAIRATGEHLQAANDPQTEERLIAADVHRNELKNSGELERRRHRDALAEQIRNYRSTI